MYFTSSTSIKIKHLASVSVLIVAGFAHANALSEETKPRRLEQLNYGQMLYQLYQGDHKRTLEAIALAETLGVPTVKQSELKLLKGGVSLAYGLTQSANELFSEVKQVNTADKAADNSELLLKADYWLAATHFNQGRWAKAQLKQDAFQQLMHQDLLSEEQKVNLAYQQAYLNGVGEDFDVSGFLDDDSLEMQYLVYNQGVAAYASGDFATATDAFTRATDNLLDAESKPWTQLGWLGIFGVTADEDAQSLYTARQKERQALRNHAAFALGQALMSQGNMDAAFTSFADIAPDSPLAGQALLELGNIQAQNDQWLEAMSVWQYLAAKDESFVALQAQRALAYGYELLGDHVKAMAALKASERALMQSQHRLSALQQMSLTELLPRAIETVSETNSQTTAQTNTQPNKATEIWPAEHRDLHLAMLSGENARWLEQFSSLQTYQDALAEKLQMLAQFQQLINEREQEHKRRAEKIAQMDLSSPVQKAEQKLEHLTTRLQGASAIDFATQTQKSWMERLARAEQIHTAIFSLKPDALKNKAAQYQHRLRRLRGILQWQLDDTFIQRRWTHQQALKQTQDAFQETKFAYQKLQNTLEQHQGIDANRQRILVLKAQLNQRLNQANMLASRVEVYLQNQVKTLLAQRASELDMQLYHTQLAMLRLQDAQPSNDVATEGETESETIAESPYVNPDVNPDVSQNGIAQNRPLQEVPDAF